MLSAEAPVVQSNSPQSPMHRKMVISNVFVNLNQGQRGASFLLSLPTPVSMKQLQRCIYVTVVQALKVTALACQDLVRAVKGDGACTIRT